GLDRFAARGHDDWNRPCGILGRRIIVLWRRVGLFDKDLTISKRRLQWSAKRKVLGMANFLWIGSALGAALGLLHGIYLYRQQTARVLASGTTSSRAMGLYYGIWAFALWILFGAYVLAFWIVGSIVYWIARLVPRGARPDRPI